MIQINNNQGYIGNIYAKGLEICLIQYEYYLIIIDN